METQLGTYGKATIQFRDGEYAVVASDNVVINRIAVRFHVAARRLDWTDRHGVEHKWSISDAYIRRVGSYADDLSWNLRGKVCDAAMALIESSATPTTLRSAEVHSLYERAEDKRREAADLREKARLAEVEAVGFEQHATALSTAR